MRVGIAGLRRGGSVCELLQIAGLKLYAIMDPDTEALDKVGTEHSVPEKRRFTDYEKMLDGELDVVIVASPMPFHAPQSVAALNRNLHVLSEVTAATSIEQCITLKSAALNSSAVYMMAENTCYFRENQIVEAMVRGGLFGEPYYAEGQYLHAVRDLVQKPDGGYTWRKKWQMDPHGLTYPTHSLGPVMRWLDDHVVSLSARGTGPRTWTDVSGDNTAVMLCQTLGGALVSIRQDFLSQRPEGHYFQLQGTKGCYESARGLGDQNKIWLQDVHGESPKWFPLSDIEEEFVPQRWREMEREKQGAGHGGSDLMMLMDFADAIPGKIAPRIDIYKALNWTLCGIMSEISTTQGGASVTIPDTLRVDF